MKTREIKSGEYVRSVDRALYIIQFLNQEHGVTANYMSMATQIARPTTFRMLETLRGLGFVRKDEKGRYWLEPEIMSLTSGYSEDKQLSNALSALLNDLSEDIPWPLSISTRKGNSMVIRASTDLESSMAATRKLTVGWSMPGLLNSAAGTVYVAYSSDRVRSKILDMLGRDPDESFYDKEPRNELEKRLSAIAEVGYAIVEHDITWNWTDRTNAIGVPIFCQGTLFGALSLRYFRERITDEEVKNSYLSLLEEAAEKIGETLLTLESTPSGNTPSPSAF